MITIVYSSNIFSTNNDLIRLEDELKTKGVQYEFLHWKDLMNGLSPKYQLVYLRAGRNRFMAIHDDYSARLEQQGYQVIPSSQQISLSHKSTELQAVVSANIPGLKVPVTRFATSLAEVQHFFESHPDMVLKSVISTHGNKIFHITTPQDLLNAWKALEQVDFPVILQEYIDNYQFDIRVIVLGERVVFAFAKYNGDSTEFRHNLSRGGFAHFIDDFEKFGYYPFKIDQEQIVKITLSLAHHLHYTHFATDYIFDKAGNLYWLENNTAFGFWQAEKQLGVNIAAKIIDWLLQQKIEAL